MTPDAFFTAKVVGVTFCDNYPQSIFGIAGKFAIGPTPISLVRDPHNQYDQNAIQIHHDGQMIGHMPMLLAKVIGPDIDSGNSWSAEVDSIVVSPEDPNKPGIKIKVWRDNETQ